MENPHPQKPPVDRHEPIGDASHEDRELRLRCLVEAREQGR